MSEFHENERSYLKTISKPDQIFKHPANLSPTKQLYTFSHAERFGSSKLKFNCKAEFYSVNESLFKTKRSCSLGKGNRFDFSKSGGDSPPANSYFPKNSNIENNKSRGYSFGLSRESCPQFGIVPFLKLEAQKPGPGAYTPVLQKSQKTTTFHIRTVIPRSVNLDIGPGKYNVPSSIQVHKTIMNSKFRSTKSTKFAPLKENKNANQKENKSSAFKNSLNFVFDKSHQINRYGVYFNSKYKNSMCRYFGKFKRCLIEKTDDFPGPGSYKQVSEFGFYESSKAKHN